MARHAITTTAINMKPYLLSRINDAYRLFENKDDEVIKVAITNGSGANVGV